MNKSIFLYDNIGSPDFISKILEHVNKKKFHDGQVGNRINTKQKKRRDLFVTSPQMLRYIDNIIFDEVYDNIKLNFGDIKYREKWKIGKYYGNQEGFYNSHRDTTGSTCYRKMSVVYGLTDPSEYEGGSLVFDELGLEFKLKKGQIILFDSSQLHRVTKVTSGIRTVLVGFMFDEEGCQIKKNISQQANFTNYISKYIPLLDNITLNYNDNKLSDTSLNTIKKTSFGDIDYSDKHSGNPWKTTDDYYIEDNKSDTLLILFAGMGWKDSIPTFIFYNFLKSYTNVDKLFLRDINCRYYIAGIKNSTGDFKETIEMYRNLINRKKYKKVIAMGCSSGGFAAILYGQLLNIDKVIAFNPQTVLNDNKENLIGDIYNAPKTCKWLRSLHLEDSEYQKALDLNNYRPFKTKIEIHYSVNGNKGIDKKHAKYIESSNCSTVEHQGSKHMIALTLRDTGKLKNIIDEAIGNITMANYVVINA